MSRPVKICLLLIAAASSLGGCATWKNSSAQTEIESLDLGAARLRLVADTDSNETSHFVSKTVSKETEAGKKTKTSTDGVEFTVQSKIVSVDIEKERMKVAMKTIDKKGTGDLHESALPELGEEIIFELDDASRVYSAGKYPPASIFFVPPLSLPDSPVRKGDSWSMEAEWVNASNTAPFHMQITSVLKDFVRCGEYRCADIEISGSAKILGLNEAKARFGSQIRGRYLFTIETGSVLWSIVRSEQNFSTSKVSTTAYNCFFSRLTSPQKMVWSGVQSTTCQPEKEIPADLAKALRL